ncbi:MAG: peptide ABC transporter substrate-binding protein [Anaerolineae bacterium]|nr:peptide ABC transporter substrate-binding protein [Anaerolineae bacterium]
MLCQWRYVFAAFTAATLLLTGCAPQFVTVTVTTPPETVVVTATPSPSPISTLLPSEPKVLTICLAGEPDTLYLYGGSRLAATRHVMEALYDGPIDYLNYAYQPVILQKVPSIADGDAVTRTVRVREGDRVVDAEGGALELVEGMRVRPAGCHADECAVEFEGEPLWMERMEVTFVLREDVTWADGEPLTADDSAFAFHVASDPATPSSHYLIARTASYRFLDRWRVKWVGLPGFISPTYFLNFFAPLPRHQLEDRSPAELLQADETRRRPLGWGPFVVEEWVAGDHITLSPNPHYFRAAEGLPYLDQVVFKFASGESDMIARILSGECDVSTQDAGFRPFMPLLVQAEQHGLLEVISATSNGWEHIDFGIAPVSDYRQADLFGDVRVRQAIVQCIDRQAIVDEVTYGHSVVPDSYLPPVHPLYAGDRLVHWDYDPAAGRVLLEEVGWLDESGDGVREAHSVRSVRAGTPFEITLLIPSDSTVTQQTARIAKANLADCGIRVHVEVLFQWEFFADGPDGPLFGRQFDLAETTWWFDVIPSCGHYMSSEIPDKGRWYGDNPAGYSNPDYDAVCQAALQALPGTQQYEEYHKQAQVIFSEELPAIPLFMWLRVALARPGVLNFTLDSTAQSELWNIEMLDLQEMSP